MIGADGLHLLSAINAATAQPELALLPTVQALRQVWATQHATGNGRMRLGSAAELPPSAEQACSPYDPEARYSNKREPRIIGLQAREHFEAQQGARRHQKTEAFREGYAARAGIEGTHAQAISRCGLRRCRCIGLAKTRLQHVLTAVAVNLVRVAEWCAGTRIAKTRRSRFAALQVAA